MLFAKGTLSIFLTISTHEYINVVLVPLVEEDLLDPDEMDFSSGGFASGEVYLGKSRLNFRRAFLVRTIFQPSTVVLSLSGATIFKVGVISPGTSSLVCILRVRGLLEEFRRLKMLLELFSIKIFIFIFIFIVRRLLS